MKLFGKQLFGEKKGLSVAQQKKDAIFQVCRRQFKKLLQLGLQFPIVSTG